MNNPKPEVLSFLDSLEKDNALKAAKDNINKDPEIKLRKLQDTKQDAKEQCLQYILKKLCKDSLPDMSDVAPVRSDVVPDLDRVVNGFVASRTGGNDATFYVHEALKKNPNHCLKKVVESVDSIIKKRYMEKELSPQEITEDDLRFRITPEVETDLERVIRDNNIDDLADVIKQNVRADAVDEIAAAKKEQEDRKRLEEELMQDDSITSESALEEALAKRAAFKGTTVYQPALFEAVLIHAFNEVANDGTVQDCITEGTVNIVRSSLLSGLPSGMFNDVSGSMESCVKQCNVILANHITTECKDVVSRYITSVNPLNLEEIPEKIKAACSNGRINCDQSIGIADIPTYQAAIRSYGSDIREFLKGQSEGPDAPAITTKEISLTDLPEAFSDNIRYLDSVMPKITKVEDYVRTYVSYGEKICDFLDTDRLDDIITVYENVYRYALITLEFAQAVMDNILRMLQYTQEVMDFNKKESPEAKAFENALCEYTMLNVAKALRLESFSLQELKDLAYQYAKNKR